MAFDRRPLNNIFKTVIILLVTVTVVLTILLITLNHIDDYKSPEGTASPTGGVLEANTPLPETGNPSVETASASHTPMPGNTPSPSPYVTSAPTEKPTEIPTETPPLTEQQLLSMPLKAPEKDGGALVISEVMSSNTRYVSISGQNYDWIELVNISSSTVNLADYTMSDRLMKPEKFKLPSKNLAPGEYVILYCSGLGTGIHAPFKISSSGETLYLFKNGNLLDTVDVPGDLGTDNSYARYGRDWVYSVKPTPEGANAAGRYTRLAAPSASLSSGYYSEAVTVTLTGPGKIYYTTDGTAPGASSALYTKPLEITKPTSLRCVCIHDGETGAEADFTYIVDKESSTLPILNVAVNMDLLTGEGGVFSDITEPFKGTEAPVLITLIEDGEEKFSVPCGFKLNGNDSRKGAKQSFRLRFKSAYGPSKLNYKVFDDLNIDAFDSLVLRGGSEDFKRAMMRDELCAAAVSGKTNLYVQAAKPVVLYIGGEYWGIYFIRERLDEDYVEEHFNVDSKNVELVETLGYVKAGDPKDYNALAQFCKTKDLNVQENFDYVAARVDLTGLIDWYVCRSYFGDHDIGNFRMFKSKEADNLWHYMCFDLDWPFLTDRQKEDTFDWYIKNSSDTIFTNLIKSQLFKNMLLSRWNELKNGALSDANILSCIDKLENLLSADMERDRIRWGVTMSSWRSQVQGIRSFIKGGRLATYDANMQKYAG